MDLGVEDYIRLMRESLDEDVLNDPDNQVIINDFVEKNLVQAEIDCMFRIHENENDSLVWAFFGLLMMLRKDPFTAGPALEKAVASDPKNIFAMNLLGDFLCRNGESKRGEGFYFRSLQLKKKQAHPFKMLYYQFMSRKEYERALRMIQAVLLIEPNDGRAWASIEYTIRKMESETFAEAIMITLTKHLPKQYRAWYIYGNLLHRAGKYKEAEKAVRRSIELRDDYVGSWSLLGSILSDQGKIEEAIECYLWAVKFKPMSMELWVLLSLLFLKNGDESEWKRALNLAMSINPEKARTLLENLERKEKEDCMGDGFER